ncbi:Uncharacterized protein Rs2_09586 [Raphanus sativus]|nr:Uncharacterized protein Rs2_09586 [Raphanus sativus]
MSPHGWGCCLWEEVVHITPSSPACVSGKRRFPYAIFAGRFHSVLVDLRFALSYVYSCVLEDQSFGFNPSSPVWLSWWWWFNVLCESGGISGLALREFRGGRRGFLPL